MLEEKHVMRKVLELLVDETDKIDIKATVTENTAIYEISVADSDLGKVLGKKGAHADALRTIFAAIYGKQKKKLHLQVLDPRRKNLKDGIQ